MRDDVIQHVEAGWVGGRSGGVRGGVEGAAAVVV